MKKSHLVKLESLKELLKQDYTFIDLRKPSQYRLLHIAKFINIPDYNFNNYIDKLDRNKPIYLICYSGTTSAKLALQLRQLGFEAYSFEGGFYQINYSTNLPYY